MRRRLDVSALRLWIHAAGAPVRRSERGRNRPSDPQPRSCDCGMRSGACAKPARPRSVLTNPLIPRKRPTRLVAPARNHRPRPIVANGERPMSVKAVGGRANVIADDRRQPFRRGIVARMLSRLSAVRPRKPAVVEGVVRIYRSDDGEASLRWCSGCSTRKGSHPEPCASTRAQPWTERLSARPGFAAGSGGRPMKPTT